MRTIVLEDNTLVCDLLIHACETDLNCTVVGSAHDGTRGKELVEKLRPELLITDMNMPGCSGIDVARFCREHSPSTRILMISSHGGDFVLSRIDPDTIDGFIDKNTQVVATLKRAVDAMRRGERFFSPASVQHQLGKAPVDQDPSHVLTNQELLVLSLIGEALSNDEIANRLGITPKTVATHRGKILRKLRIPGSPKLTYFALKNGFSRLVDQPPHQ
jgi:DNA-binding NarL/FixJ family response regulator